MALIDPPAFLGLAGNSYTAARLRRVHQLMLGGREGCLGPSDMAVSQTSTPGLSVQVAAGAAIVNGDDAVRQGAYVVESDGAVTVGPISTPHASLGRLDRLVLEVLDQEGTVSGGGGRGSDEPRCRFVAGTPSASPAPPAEPPTAVTLAVVYVAPGASAILNANIQDERPPLNPQGSATGVVDFYGAWPEPPWGAVLANGQAIPRARYSRLFDLIGTTFGSGDGGFTFNVPDLRLRSPVGVGSAPGLIHTRNLGDKWGAEYVLLTGRESGTQQHRHGRGNMRVAILVPQLVVAPVLQRATDPGSGNNLGLGGYNDTVFVTGDTENAGHSNALDAHNNMGPSLALTPIIWT